MIWLFKLVAGSRNYYQLGNEFRGDKFKSIALMAWACAKLEDELLLADTSSSPASLIDRIYEALLLLCNEYMSFEFDRMYVYWPTELLEPAQIRPRHEVAGITLEDQEKMLHHDVVVYIASCGCGINYAGNVTKAHLEKTRVLTGSQTIEDYLETSLRICLDNVRRDQRNMPTFNEGDYLRNNKQGLVPNTLNIKLSWFQDPEDEVRAGPMWLVWWV